MSAVAVRADYLWRRVSTVIGTATFWLGALLLSLSIFPLLILLLRDRAQRQRAARAVIRVGMRAFVAWVQLLGILRVEVRGAAHLQQGGQLIIANHPTLIDAVLLLAYVPQATCIVKSALAHNPFTMAAVRVAGYIPNHTDPELLLADCAQTLKDGHGLLIFPEGTRRDASAPMQLHRGAARVAIAAQQDLLPVVIRCTPSMLGKNDPWHLTPKQRPCWTLDVGQPIAIKPHLDASIPAPLAARRLTRVIERALTAQPIPAECETSSTIHARAA